MDEQAIRSLQPGGVRREETMHPACMGGQAVSREDRTDHEHVVGPAGPEPDLVTLRRRWIHYRCDGHPCGLRDALRAAVTREEPRIVERERSGKARQAIWF